MDKSNKKLFESSEIAQAYAKYRPKYGNDVFECIINYCKETHCGFSLAVDVACGNGQSTVPLAKHFQKVIGVDVSKMQISQAPTDIPNISFCVGPAEDLSFIASETADLVTIATALHWLDLDSFYPEVQRILKPGGIFVTYTYELTECVLDDPRGTAILRYFFVDVLGPYRIQAPSVVEHLHRSFPLPFPDWKRNDDLEIKCCWTVDHLVGFLSSYSAWHTFLASNPDSSVLEHITCRLKEIYCGENQSEHEVNITWQVHMLMGCKPLH